MTTDTVHYTVFRHHKNKVGKTIYYAHFYDPETGMRLPAISTRQTNKKTALDWCFQKALSGEFKRTKEITFREFTNDWWDYEKCGYIKKQLAHGRSLTKSYASLRRSELKRYLWPAFGKLKLSKITITMVEDFMMGLKTVTSRYGKPLSEKTINHVVANLKKIINEAYRLDLIQKNPVENMGTLAEKPRRKQILSHEEAKILLKEETIQQVWKGDLKMYCLNLLAASTAMRMGECQALHFRDIDFTNNTINIKYSFERKFGLKAPKWDSYRVVTVPSKTMKYLRKVIDASPNKDNPAALIFANQSSPVIPIDHKTIAEKLYAALEAIGIYETERRLRNLTFHSWRHFLNTYLRYRIPDELLRKVTGHRDEQMTNHYTQFNLDKLQPVRQIQEALL